MMHLSLYDISLLRCLVRAIYRNESVACCTIYRCGDISQERYITTAIYRKNDISARYRREAPISRRIIVATHRLYVRYIAEISSIYRKNKGRYLAIIVCITFAQYCNLLSTVITVALWLGNDDYETVQKCAGAVYEQFMQLTTIKHPLSGKEIKIVRRSCGDGKERRSSTGNSSAKSSYPIPEAPEHRSQLGDMKLYCPCPVWSVNDTETLEKKFKMEVGKKAPSKEKHREFARQNLGNTGCKNICGTPLSEYYPGTSHLGFRSAETICLRIAKIASGLYL